MVEIDQPVGGVALLLIQQVTERKLHGLVAAAGGRSCK